MVFDVEITPKHDGKDVKTTDKMREAEGQKQLYTQLIQEIMKLHEPDYKESLGQIQGLDEKGLIFENGILPHRAKTTALYKKFIEKLHKPE